MNHSENQSTQNLECGCTCHCGPLKLLWEICSKYANPSSDAEHDNQDTAAAEGKSPKKNTGTLWKRLYSRSSPSQQSQSGQDSNSPTSKCGGKCSERRPRKEKTQSSKRPHCSSPSSPGTSHGQRDSVPTDEEPAATGESSNNGSSCPKDESKKHKSRRLTGKTKNLFHCSCSSLVCKKRKVCVAKLERELKKSREGDVSESISSVPSSHSSLKDGSVHEIHKKYLINRSADCGRQTCTQTRQKCKLSSKTREEQKVLCCPTKAKLRATDVQNCEERKETSSLNEPKNEVKKETSTHSTQELLNEPNQVSSNNLSRVEEQDETSSRDQPMDQDVPKEVQEQDEDTVPDASTEKQEKEPSSLSMSEANKQKEPSSSSLTKEDQPREPSSGSVTSGKQPKEPSISSLSKKEQQNGASLVSVIGEEQPKEEESNLNSMSKADEQKEPSSLSVSKEKPGNETSSPSPSTGTNNSLLRGLEDVSRSDKQKKESSQSLSKSRQRSKNFSNSRSKVVGLSLMPDQSRIIKNSFSPSKHLSTEGLTRDKAAKQIYEKQDTGAYPCLWDNFNSNRMHDQTPGPIVKVAHSSKTKTTLPKTGLPTKKNVKNPCSTTTMYGQHSQPLPTSTYVHPCAPGTKSMQEPDPFTSSNLQKIFTSLAMRDQDSLNPFSAATSLNQGVVESDLSTTILTQRHDVSSRERCEDPDEGSVIVMSVRKPKQRNSTNSKQSTLTPIHIQSFNPPPLTRVGKPPIASCGNVIATAIPEEDNMSLTSCTDESTLPLHQQSNVPASVIQRVVLKPAHVPFDERKLERSDMQTTIGSASDSVDEFEEEGLMFHNVYRQQHGVPVLRLNKRMCVLARSLALSQLNSPVVFPYHLVAEFGMNVFSTKSQCRVFPYDACRDWYMQSEHFRFGMEPTELDLVAGFTQMIWKSSVELGFGEAKVNKRVVIVALYYPAGNIIGQFNANCPEPVILNI